MLTFTISPMVHQCFRSQAVGVCQGLDRSVIQKVKEWHPLQRYPRWRDSFANRLSRVERQVRGSNPPPVTLDGTV
jgi:hypothetical protein